MTSRFWRSRPTGDNAPSLPDQLGGVPHPAFVEELMGYPTGWTDLRPLATDRFRQWLQQQRSFWCRSAALRGTIEKDLPASGDDSEQ